MPEGGEGDGLTPRQISVLVADVEGFSEMTEPEQTKFFGSVLPTVAELTGAESLVERNSWGDGIVTFFRDPLSAAEAALDLRDYFRDNSWRKELMPTLRLRIALHNTTVWTGHNPIRETTGVVGTGVNLTARIEPIVTPNHVFTSAKFRQDLVDQQPHDSNITFERLPERELAKGWGKEQLYEMRRQSDRPVDPQNLPELSEEQPTTSASGVEALTVMLDREDPNLQLKAARLLAKEPTPAAIQPLTEVMDDEENLARVRAGIAEVLREWDDARVVDPLIRATESDPDETVRRKAAFSLGEIGDASASPALKEVVRDTEESDDVRVAAVTALGKIQEPHGIDPLIDVLEDRSESSGRLRRVVAQILGELDNDRAIDPLIFALDDPEESVRGTAVESLKELGDIRAVEPISDRLSSETETNPRFRVACAKALSAIGAGSSVEALLEGLDHPETSVQVECIRALGEVGTARPQATVDPLVAAVDDATRTVDTRALAAGSLGEVGTQAAVEFVSEVACDDETYPAQIRRGAVAGLGECGLPSVVGPLVEATDDDSFEVRKEAVQAISKAGVNQRAAVDRLTTVATDPDGHRPELRRLALLALGRLNAFDSVDAMVEAVDDSRERVQVAAIQELSKMDTETGYETLVGVLQDESYSNDVRGAAAQWIGEYQESGHDDRLLEILTASEFPRVRSNLVANFGAERVTHTSESIIDIVESEPVAESVEHTAVLALSLVGGRDAESVITGVIRDDEKSLKVRRVACSALRSLGTNTARSELQSIAQSEGTPDEVRVKAQTLLQRQPEDIRDNLQSQLLQYLNRDADDEE
jgi:HEAT repeat protein/class 3 adenylate cyclase